MASGKNLHHQDKKPPSYYLKVAMATFLVLGLIAMWAFSSSSSPERRMDGMAHTAKTMAAKNKLAKGREDETFEDSIADLPQETGEESLEDPVSLATDNDPSFSTKVEKPRRVPGDSVDEKAMEEEEQTPTTEGEKGKVTKLPKKTEPELEPALEIEENTERAKFDDPLVGGGQLSEIVSETTEASDEWVTQAKESREENKVLESVKVNNTIEEERASGGEESNDGGGEKVIDLNRESDMPSEEEGEGQFTWKLCENKAGIDYIPCLDNQEALKKLHTTMHFQHRERHCPDPPPTCLVPLPEGYLTPIAWPQSRNEVWYKNVPHPGLASYKKDQNWVKKSGERLIFPGGGTQFKEGVKHYIDYIEQTLPAIAWGKRTRVILDVGCGVASFGGYLLDQDVLALSFAPKDEHEAQVQLALERGIPAMLSVMGTQRLVFPSNVFDILHCARCRVPWHIEGGKLLLELNRVLRPGGFFVWSATPVYLTDEVNAATLEAMVSLTISMCWKMVAKSFDSSTGIGVAIFQKPRSNTCYERRKTNEPPICNEDDKADAAWYVPITACLHKIPSEEGARAREWPRSWPQRLGVSPSWLSNSEGIYGNQADADFHKDMQHWKHAVEGSYTNGFGIDWGHVRNVMDMRAVYGGFAAALVEKQVWVMNVVPTDEPDTLPVIFDRGLIGLYHDWCESFSTYPRTYDLLHADHLFSKLQKRCKIVFTVVEMDRILRPDGWAIFRDESDVLSKIEKIIRSLHWEIRSTFNRNEEGILVAQKKFWRPEDNS